MDPPSPSRASQTQPAAPSPLTSYRWHSGGGGEKGAGGFRWGRLAGWGRAQSHQETTASSQPAPRSLFRRVLSAPPKESRTSRLKISKSLWALVSGKVVLREKKGLPGPQHRLLYPEPEPELEPLATQIPEAPTPDVPIWNIEAFTLLDGKLVLLGNEDEGPRQPRMGSASSESSIHVASGNLKDPDRTPGKTDPEAAGPHQIHNVRGLLKRLKEKKKAKSELGASASRDGPPSALGSRESLATISELDLGAERDVRVWPLHPSLLEEPHCFQVTWAGGSRCFSCRSAAERDRWIEDLRRHFQPSQDNVEREETWLSVWVHEVKGLPRAAAAAPGVRTELWLDGALLARTTPRAGPGQLFWLPSERYKELAEFLTFHYARLCGALELALSAQAKEELAAAMVRVLRATGRAQALVTDLGTAELARSGGREALLFRENTLATKAIDEYMKLVAQDYLQETLGQVVRRLCASTEDCEVDPSKCPASDLPQHQSRLRNSCKEVFENIIHSYNWFPAELGTVFSGWREACKARGSEALGPRLVCASLFLRLLCPAILSPSLFGLAPEHPAPGPARTLTLIAKVIQNLANRAPFGEKEAYMSFMNTFLEDHGPAMQHFLDQVATVDADTAPSGYQGSSDLALQLAVLHAQLCTIFAELDQATRDNLEPLPTILHAIEEGRPVPVTVPMCLPAPRTQGHSSISAGEKPGFLAPRDLPKHTPLISKSQSLRSVHGAGSWARPRLEEEQPPRLPRPVKRTQSVPAGRPARRRPSAGPRPRPKGSLHAGPAPRGRPWTGASASLPRKPSVPWQRQMDQPRDKDQALGTHRPVGKLAELQCEVAALRQDLKMLSGLVESLSTHIRSLSEQQEQLRTQLQLLDSRLREGTAKLDPGRDRSTNEGHRLKSLECRLAEIESTQAQLKDTIQNLQLLPRTSESQSQPVPLKAPCINGDTT
ncbi:PREDICTED: RAS protein activator like-3 [Bison bison bison]|uniref:RAS protein activator like-3 n=1 Tax=Bison bison bison TaxID=43346 RepID=A0A6P3GL62_BISBB|nr:PREDICTED: RAS protein activator like-3 [Bison bison bison]